VIDRSGKLLGAVTETDLLRALRSIVGSVTDGKALSSARVALLVGVSRPRDASRRRNEGSPSKSAEMRAVRPELGRGQDAEMGEWDAP